VALVMLLTGQLKSFMEGKLDIEGDPDN